MIKCIFVGDEPNAQARTNTPFRHARCAERLNSWIDYLVDDHDYIIVNQCDGPTDFSVPVVALGTKASKYLTKLLVPHFVLLHPSGLNRQINDKAKLFLMLRACKAFLG